MIREETKELLCEKTKWEDLSSFHKSLREELERTILDYARKVNKEYLAPIIVAPYGSGKSELLKYLCCYCWKNNIPALYVKDFNIIVEELKRKVPPRDKIHESRLPGILIEFFKENLKIILNNESLISEIEYCCGVGSVKEIITNFLTGHIRGVLLIDEIEEAYDEFKKLIIYDTSPFRKVYDKIKTNSLDIFVIMAFGPSSIAKETVSLASGWRTKLYSIPIIPPSTFYNPVVNEIKYDDLKWTAQYIANMIWFASKGRIGWGYNLISAGLVGSIVKNLYDKNFDLTLLHGEHLLNTLEKEIIEGIPLFNYTTYRAYLSETRHKELFKILSVLVGPVKESKLKELIDIERYKGIKLGDIFIKSKKLVDVYEVVDKIKLRAETLLSEAPVEKDRIERILRELVYTVEVVLKSWSYNYQLLLPRDNRLDPIKNLIELASSLLLEQYQAEASNILDQIDIEDIIEELIDEDKVYKDIENYYALHPKVLMEIYPPVMLKPLLACSKNEELNIKFRSFDEYLDINDDLHKYMKQAINYSLFPRDRISVFIVPFHIIRYLGKEFNNIVAEKIQDNKLVILIPIGRSGAELEKVVEEIMKRLYPFIKLGLVSVAENIGNKLSLFLYGCMYSLIKCPSEFRSSLRNDEVAKYIFNQYTRSYKQLIEQQVGKITRVHANIEYKIQKIFNDPNMNKLVEKLIKSKGRELGSRQARYFWFFPLVKEEVIYKFKNVIGCLSKLAEELKNVEDNLNILGYEKGVYEAAFDKLKLLSQKKSTLDYLSKVLKLSKEIDRIDDVLKYYRELLKIFVERNSQDICDFKLEDALTQVFERLPEMIKPLGDPTNPVIYYLLGESIKHTINKRCKNRDQSILYIGIRNDIGILIKSLEETIGKINSFRNKLSEFSDELPTTFIENINELLNHLNNIKKSLNDLLSVYLEINNSEFVSRLDYFSLRIVYDFIIDSIIETFVSNLKKSKESGKSFNEVIFSIMQTLEKINRTIDDIERKTDDLDSGLSTILPEASLRNVVRNDLIRIFNIDFSLNKIKENLDRYLNEELRKVEKVLKDYDEYIKYMKQLKHLVSRFEKIVEG